MKQLLALLLAASAPIAATPAFQLGLSYSESLNIPGSSYGIQLVTDSSGALYFLTTLRQSNPNLSIVTKLTSDGKKLLWQNQLGLPANSLTVDPNGGVYVLTGTSDTTSYVAKLSPAGIGLEWKRSLGFQGASLLAVDARGRVYAAGKFTPNDFIVVRLNELGSADFINSLKGEPDSLAIDSSGAAYFAGRAPSPGNSDTGFLARVGPDGAPGYYTRRPLGFSEKIAVDGKGNVTLYGYDSVIGAGLVQRIDAAGAVALTTTVYGGSQFALDAAGNAYLSGAANHPTKNSLATCGYDPAISYYDASNLLQVVAPDGSTLQATYLPGGIRGGQLVVAPNGTVFLVSGLPAAGFTPTQAGPFHEGPAYDNFVLSNLSTTAPPAPTYSLTCAGNSASLRVGPISPGEMVTLFGSGLGPQAGFETRVAAPDRYPVNLANVTVTFDGTPAPLLYVQDSQINLVAPWSLIPGKNTEICVSWNNVKTNCLTWPVAEISPAIFMVDFRYAAALNQDGTLNSAANPAAPGSIVSIYATGLGPISPSQPDGAVIGLPLPANNIPLSVVASYGIKGAAIDVPLEVTYAGPAPALVAGVSQINFRVVPYPSFGAIFLHFGSTLGPGFSVHIAGQ